jgi:hypothetical protein
VHERARGLIGEFIESAQSPIDSGDIASYLKSRGALCFSRSTLIRYLRVELGLSYRRLGLITPSHNSEQNLCQRQAAASHYIELLHQGKCIINVDESVLRMTDHRKRGWMPYTRRNFVSKAVRLARVNIIAAASSRGEIYFTLNQGTTNAPSFLLFLKKLVEHLDSTDPAWRASTVIMVDNAKYHRAQIV